MAEFADAGADSISVHYEATPNVHFALKAVREAGWHAGLALNPGTPVSAVDALHGSFDHLLCMTVNPGWGGQTWIPESNARIDALRSVLPGDVPIQVDGGVDASTAGPAVTSGASLLVAGSSVFGAAGPRRGLPGPGACRRSPVASAAASSRGATPHRLGRRTQ